MGRSDEKWRGKSETENRLARFGDGQVQVARKIFDTWILMVVCNTGEEETTNYSVKID